MERPRFSPMKRYGIGKMIFGASALAFFHNREPTWKAMREAIQSITSLNLGVEIWIPCQTAGRIFPGPDSAVLHTDKDDLPFISMHTQLDSWDRQALCQEIDQCAALGATTLVLHNKTLGCHHSSAQPDYPEIARLAQTARLRGIAFALENSSDNLWFLDQILDRIGDDPQKTNIGVCIDVGHAHMSTDAGRQPIRAYLKRYKEQLIHLHLHDNDGKEDLHRIPGEGSINWPEALETIHRIDYRGPAVIELHSSGDPITDIKRATRFFAHLTSKTST
ncbi:sugar phosphate isomerase/epimerase [Candidatus Bipolaricaulota bacterium]|nr:sugar phosphate isomerase/epimerase [Candidatus Bipolaricaulota bacterium]